MRVLLAISGIVLVYILKLVTSKRKQNPRRLPYPPGPKGYPIVGNLFQLPAHKPWLAYKEFGRQYGDMTYLEAMGQPMLIVNSLSRALDLLDKRAVNYSDRAWVPTMEMMKLRWVFAFMQYGNDWRNHRRAFHRYFNHNVVHNYHAIQEQAAVEFLRSLAAAPKDFLHHTRQLFGSVIIRISYGFEDAEYNQNLVKQAETLVSGFSESMVPGRYLINYFPMLKHLPSWLPGAGFKRHFKFLSEISDEVVGVYEEVKVSLRTGKRTVGPSLAAGLIDEISNEKEANREEQELIARNISALSYIAGADTTVSSAHALILALGMHPEVQRKAQEEIDHVIGNDRLPVMADKESLPYITAIVKEAGRWHTVVPLGIVHASSNDDEYEGYFIPKGTFVYVNTWAIMHDPEVFDEPFKFKPERYMKDGRLDPTVLDPESATFGFGRRICPGRWLSNDSLFLMAASLVAAFNIVPAKDEQGQPIPLKYELPSDIIIGPLPFKCDLQIRSPKTAALLQK
ncbi:cytochrome P450 98A3 [Coprinopsis sp. MPI-PUGE-AT-0042]|nr:cytochrome P450 98A3 [Coprinopsis sp. MPI-PUGE-AT-0042]